MHVEAKVTEAKGTKRLMAKGKGVWVIYTTILLLLLCGSAFRCFFKDDAVARQECRAGGFQGGGCATRVETPGTRGTKLTVSSAAWSGSSRGKSPRRYQLEVAGMSVQAMVKVPPGTPGLPAQRWQLKTGGQARTSARDQSPTRRVQPQLRVQPPTRTKAPWHDTKG